MVSKKDELAILIVPNLIPFPPNDGGRLCIYGLIDYLRKFHRIHLLLSANDADEAQTIRQLELHWPDVTVDSVDLYQQSTLNTGQRVKAIIKKSIKGFYGILQKIKVNKTSLNDTYDGYDIHKTTPFYPHTDVFIQKLCQITGSNKFDIIQIELTRMLNLVNILPNDVKKVFVQIEERNSVIYDYGISRNFNPDFIRHVAGNTEFLEYAFMSQYDAILALNEIDNQKIQKKVSPRVAVYTSPYGILDKDIKELNIGNGKLENLIFMGGEIHYPNVDALNWFLTDIITNFTKRPFRKLYVTGNWSNKTINRYKQLSDCVEFIGFVDDLTPYIANSVSIVPVRLGGGGIRTKILSAMSQGSPIVTTSLAAVGMENQHQKSLLIADSAEEFVASINLLFDNQELARQIKDNAHELIVKQYSQTACGEIRRKIYSEICAADKVKQNFNDYC
ncbi:MAG: glycosyltransferase [Mucilaginibacter sp.]